MFTFFFFKKGPSLFALLVRFADGIRRLEGGVAGLVLVEVLSNGVGPVHGQFSTGRTLGPTHRQA
jgi:hypothetical protein